MSDAMTTTPIYVVTPTAPQNAPGATFIRLLGSCGYGYSVTPDVAQLPETEDDALVFFDATDPATIMPAYRQYQGAGRWVLYNLPSGELDESGAILAGIEGAFYADDPPELVAKGLRQVHNHDVWFCRQSLNGALRVLRQKMKQAFGPLTRTSDDLLTPSTVLTKRERAIVELVARGAQNRDIAEQLHISINTVKTHIYSIFRKTHCKNRIELLFWSQNYMQHVGPG